MLLLMLVIAGSAGWNLLVGRASPGAPRIEAATGSVPDDLLAEYWVRELWPSTAPPIIARLRLRNGTFLYLTDWDATDCRLFFVAKADGTDRRESGASCGILRSGFQVLDLYSHNPIDGVSPRITTGTVTSSVTDLRITFTDCGSRTYALDGPTVPSKPTRRVFLLDMGDCDWGKLEAFRNGHVVETHESYANAD